MKYGEVVELKLNEKLRFEDSLEISLTAFSHKRPYTGGPTKATAHLAISKHAVSDEIAVSVYGVAGKSESEDGLADANRYDSLVWMEYHFQLKRFDYDQSIQITVSKTGD